jgi:hypothetical protein
MKTSLCAKYLSALDRPNPTTATKVHVNHNARELRAYGYVELPVSRGVKKVTRGSKKFKAIMAKHREIIKAKDALL